LRGTGSGAASPVASRTQYLYDDAFSAVAVAATAAVSSISTRSPAPTTKGRTDWCRRRHRSQGEARRGAGTGWGSTARRVECTPILTAFSGLAPLSFSLSLSLLCLRLFGSAHSIQCGLWMRARMLQMLREPSQQLHYTLTEPSSSKQRGLAYHITVGSTVHGWPPHARHRTRWCPSVAWITNVTHQKCFFFLCHKKRNVKLCPAVTQYENKILVSALGPPHACGRDEAACSSTHIRCPITQGGQRIPIDSVLL
jgi:hypothetical protein